MQYSKLIPSPLIRPQDREKVTFPPERKKTFFLSLWQKMVFCFEIVHILSLHITLKYFPSKKAHQQRQKKSKIIRKILEEQGGFWIKVGQLLSLRTDLFSSEFCNEISQLKDISYPFSFGEVKKVIEESLHKPLEHIFDYFEEIPFSVASIGQIHRASLKREKTIVAVKIQRPKIKEKFKRNMTLIHIGIRFCEIFSLYSQADWTEMILELEQIFVEELDYRIEVTSVDRMKKKLKKHKIYVPSFYPQYSTRKVMIMELLQGVRISDFIKTLHSDPFKVQVWLKENNVNPKKVAKRLFCSVYRQMLEDNLFHANLHPDNIVLLKNSRFAFIDFGGVGVLEKEAVQKIGTYYRLICEERYSQAIDSLFLLASNLPLMDLQEVKRKLMIVYRDWELCASSKELPYDMRSLTGLTQTLMEILVPLGITFEWAFLQFNRSSAILDESLVYLHPKIHYPTVLKKHFQKSKERSIKKQAKKPRFLQFNQEIQEIPEKVSELMGFQLATARHGAQVFRTTLSRGSLFLGTILKSVALGFKISLCFLIYGLIYKHNLWITQYDLGWPTKIVREITVYSSETWIVMFLANLYFLQTSSSIAKKMVAKDTRRNSNIPKD